MKLTQEDREHFSKRLHKLADAFNNTTGKRLAENKKRKKPLQMTRKQLAASDRRQGKVNRLIDEFRGLGYSRKQWNRLVTTSGVEAKMEPYGGAYFIPSQKFLRELSRATGIDVKKALKAKELQ